MEVLLVSTNQPRPLVCPQSHHGRLCLSTPCTCYHIYMYDTKHIYKVEAEIHEALLGCDGLVEPEATNQGAWLTESAGALADLHASVLEGLSGFTNEPPVSPPPYSSDSSPARLDKHTTTTSISRLEDERETREGAGSSVACCGRFGQGGDSGTEGGGGGDDDVGGAAARVGTGSIGGDAGGSGGGGRPGAAVVTDGRVHADQERRTRLHHLGRLLARRRQFTASRQVPARVRGRGGGRGGYVARNPLFSSRRTHVFVPLVVGGVE